MKNERKITNSVTKKTTTKKGNIKKQDKSLKKVILNNNNKTKLKPAEFPEAIVEVIINKIISYVVHQTSVK